MDLQIYLCKMIEIVLSLLAVLRPNDPPLAGVAVDYSNVEGVS